MIIHKSSIAEFWGWLEQSGHLYIPAHRLYGFRTSVKHLLTMRRPGEPDDLQWLRDNAETLARRAHAAAAISKSSKISYASRMRSTIDVYRGNPARKQHQENVTVTEVKTPEEVLETFGKIEPIEQHYEKTTKEEVQDLVPHLHKWPKLMPFLITAIHDALKEGRK